MSIFKTSKVVSKMEKANKYTYQRVLRFFDNYDSTVLSAEERQDLQRILKKELQTVIKHLS